MDNLTPHTTAAPPAPGHYRFTVEDVGRMLDVGILKPDIRFELWDGQLLLMAPFKVSTSRTLARLIELLYEHRPGSHVEIRPGSPVDIGDPHFLPEPDISLADNTRDAADHENPGARDTYLVVEISDTTKKKDLGRVSTYAHANIREYWIVDVPSRTVTVHRKPLNDCYQSILTHTQADNLAVEAIPQIAFRASEIFQ